MSKAICSVKTPGCTYLGINATEKISGILEKENAKKVIVLTDRGVYDTGLCTRVLEQLNGAAYHLYTDIKREPSYLDVEDVVQTIEDLQCDMIVAVGGGSVMDTAKLCSVLKNAPYSIKDLLRDPALAHKQIKTVFLPTTCGTGSEATCNAIVAIPEESVKKGIVNDEMIPDYAILDPEMIRHLPPAIVAATGVDALAHAVECYTSLKATPLSDLYAREGARLIFHNIVKAYRDPEDMDAKKAMLLAAYYGSIIRRTEIPMKFVMTQSLCAEGLALLDQAHVDYISADDGDPNHYPQLMQDADALIVRIGKCDAAALACCPQLKVIGRPGIGYDSVDVAQATKLGIPVVVTPGANGRSVAEHTVAMMLSLSKNLVEANNETLQGHWSIRDAHKAFQWEGKTVGIIGLGPIGRETAKICLGIGMKVIGFDSFFSKEQIQSWGVEYCQNKEDLLRTSDIVSVHMPLVEATRNLICASELALMKKTALLINTSRGGIVNEADLLQALTSGQITAAGLDVFCSEPLRVDDPLLQAPNLLVTPHAAAQTREAVIQMATMCVEGCLAVCRGEQWPYVVDKNVYDHPRWADCK